MAQCTKCEMIIEGDEQKCCQENVCIHCCECDESCAECAKKKETVCQGCSGCGGSAE